MMTIELDMPFVLFKDRPQLPAISGIYIAIDGDTAVYVGKAKNIRSRWKNHHRLVQMRAHYRIYWFGAPVADLDRLEREFIELLSPALNDTLAPSSMHFSGETQRHLRDLVSELELDYTAVVELAIARFWRQEVKSDSPTPEEQRRTWQRRSGRLL